jgi:hypothetical protein
VHLLQVLQSDGNTESFDTEVVGDNGLYKLQINVVDVVELTVTFPNAGAVAELNYYICPETADSDGTDDNSNATDTTDNVDDTTNVGDDTDGVDGTDDTTDQTDTTDNVDDTTGDGDDTDVVDGADDTTDQTDATDNVDGTTDDHDEYGKCHLYAIDFDSFSEGQYVTNELESDYFVTVEATGGYTPDGAARVFNTANPGTTNNGNPELGSPKCRRHR